MPTTLYDSTSFIEGLLKHMLHCPEVFKRTQELNMTGEEFLTDGIFGIKAYKLIAETIIKIKHVPVEQALFVEYLRIAMEENPSYSQLAEQIIPLVILLYTPTIYSPAYYISELLGFVQHRRYSRAYHKHGEDVAQLVVDVAKINHELSTDSWINDAEKVYPFAKLVEKPIFSMIPTGYVTLDTILGGGLGYGEYGLLIGHSGAGKTALAVNLAYNAVLLGKKAVYFSIEDTVHNIVNRFYSRAYKLSYTSLHNGSGNMELNSKWGELEQLTQEALEKNLIVDSLVNAGFMNCDQLYTRLTSHYEEDGFIPDLVIVDQFQFIRPIVGNPSENAWDVDRIASEELDQLSHKTVANKNFGLWVLHQAKGSPKARYTSNDLQGFKGIIQKADNVFCLGREKLTSDECCIFSVKCRHAKNFELKFKAELEFMTISESAESGTAGGESKPTVFSPNSVISENKHEETVVAQSSTGTTQQLLSLPKKVHQGYKLDADGHFPAPPSEISKPTVTMIDEVCNKFGN